MNEPPETMLGTLPFPDGFETARLLVRSPLPGDEHALVDAVNRSLAELRPWMPWAKEPSTIDGQGENVRSGRDRYLRRTDLWMIIWDRSTNGLIGGTGLHRIDWKVPRFEIGYWRTVGAEGRGYITETVRGITAFAFDCLGANRVEVRMDSQNEKSRRVALRAGFQYEGTLHKDSRSPSNELRDTFIYSLLPSEYHRLRDAQPLDYQITPLFLPDPSRVVR